MPGQENKGQVNLARNMSMKKERLLSEAELNKVKDRYYEDANNQLEDAIRKHHNISSGGIPVWLYVVLVFFGYDDIWRMCMNPILFYPIVLVMSIVGMLYSMGLGPIMVPTVKSAVNLGMRNAGVS